MILAVGWLGVSLIKIKLQEDIVNNEVAELEKEISGLERSNSLLEKFISMMNNPAFVEREARIKLNYKSPDENVVFVYPDTGEKTEAEEKQKENLPNYVKWFYYLISE